MIKLFIIKLAYLIEELINVDYPTNIYLIDAIFRTALPRLMYAEDNLRYSCPIFYRFKFFLVGFKHDDEVDIDENCKHYGMLNPFILAKLKYIIS